MPGKRMKKMCCVHSVEYNYALKSNEVLIQATLELMNLENSVLSEEARHTKGHRVCNSTTMKCLE